MCGCVCMCVMAIKYLSNAVQILEVPSRALQIHMWQNSPQLPLRKVCIWILSPQNTQNTHDNNETAFFNFVLSTNPPAHKQQQQHTKTKHKHIGTLKKKKKKKITAPPPLKHTMARRTVLVFSS